MKKKSKKWDGPTVKPEDWLIASGEAAAAKMERRDGLRKLELRLARLEAEVGGDGVVSAFEMYTREGLKRRLGVGDAAIRAAVVQGLKYVRIGRKNYFVGSEVIEFLKTKGAEQRKQREEGTEPRRWM